MDGAPEHILDFWVSDDHLVRRLTTTTRQGKESMRFYDFNEPITILAPEVN